MKGLVIRIDRLVGEAIMALACLALALAALTGLYQVATRFLFHQPSSWSEVLTRTLVVWMVFLGLSAALRGGALLSVDLVYRLVGRTPYLGILRLAIATLTIAFLSIVLYFGIDIVYRVRFQTLAGLEIPISWAYAAVPTGAAFGILATIANYLDPRRGELDLQT